MRLNLGQNFTYKGFGFISLFCPENKDKNWTLKYIHISGRTKETADGKVSLKEDTQRRGFCQGSKNCSRHCVKQIRTED